MNPETFFDKFGLLADTPNGVQKLRELILQLAVQGKLVPQDPNDEPAAVLLRKIKAEKERLFKGKKIKKVKKIPDFEEGGLPYELPNEWLWTRLDQIANSVHYGYTASANHELKDIRLLRITDIQNGRVNWDGVPGCEIDEKKLENYRLHEGDLLIARTGGTIGKSYLVEKPTLCAVFASYIIRVIPNGQLFPNYLKIFLESSLYWKQLYEKSMGTGQPNVNGTSLRLLLVPVPPLEEQRRIVAKVDQLMALCDELEARQQKKQEARLHLNSAALDKLLTAHAPDEFAHHWQRICDNVDLLYDNPENVGELRKAILQLAVQGKLVPQDPNDEPAAVLLGGIKAEKERLVKEKKIKKINTLPLIKSEKEAFKLPDGWGFIRLGEIVQKLGAGSTPKGGKAVYQNQGIKFLRSQNVWNNGLSLQNVAYIPLEIHKRMNGTAIRPGDILLNITGASIGRCATVPDNFDEGNVSQHVTIVRLIDKALRYYVHICLISPFIQDAIMDVQVGISREGLSMSQLKEFLIPIPPLEEQRRIVAKVDQLMALCDDLESKLKQSQTDGEKLVRAVVAELIGA